MQKSEAFRESLPVIITSLVNKIGTIGLSLVPLLLVERHFSTMQSSAVMSGIRSVMLFGTVLSGIISDSIGYKKSILLAYAFSAVGLILLPVQKTYVMIAVFGMIAQFGHTMGNTNLRLILAHTVSRKNQKEAFGWIRVVNNLGQVFSYLLAMFVSSLGIPFLMIFDGLTSIAAFFYGMKSLPSGKSEAVLADEKTQSGSGATELFPFIAFALVVSIWSFLYDLFFVGVAAKIKVIYPADGIRYFAIVMFVNTIICAGLAVWSTRVFKDAVKSFGLSLLLTVAGIAIALFAVQDLRFVILGSLLATFGEVIYGAVAHFVLIRLNPGRKRAGLYYSNALFVANLGRILAAAVCFPLIVYTEDYSLIAWLMTALTALGAWLLFASRKAIRLLTEN